MVVAGGVAGGVVAAGGARRGAGAAHAPGSAACSRPARAASLGASSCLKSLQACHLEKCYKLHK